MSEKKKLMIVEDDQMISCMYKTKFESDGFECLVLNSGAGVLEEAKTNKPDIILLDVILPQVDGFSVLKALKADAHIKKVPVIMLTNLGTDEDKKKGEELGAAGYLVKASLTPAELSEKIKEYLK